MTRPRSYTIAAVLMAVFSLLTILSELQSLSLGAVGAQAQFDGRGPAFFLILINFTIGVLGLPAAYGVWTMQKWGIVLTIVLNAINILTSLPVLIFAPPFNKLLGALAAVWAAAIIALLLRPQSRANRTTGRIR